MKYMDVESIMWAGHHIFYMCRTKGRTINPGRERNEGQRQSENSCLGPQRLASYYKAIVVSMYVSTDPSESRSITQSLWAWQCPDPVREAGGIRAPGSHP